MNNYKTGQLVWIGGKNLGIFLCEYMGSYYVALYSADFQVAHPFSPEIVLSKQDEKYRLHIVDDPCK